MQQRRIDDDGRFRLQPKGAGLERGGQSHQNRDPRPALTAAPKDHHQTNEGGKRGKGHDVRRGPQHAALQDQLGRQDLQHRPRNNRAVRHVEPVAEFDCRCADQNFLALDRLERCRIAAQHVDIGHRRDAACLDAEIDLQRLLIGRKLAAKQSADRRQELAVDHLAIGVMPHQTVRLDRDIDDRRPGVFDELRQRLADID